jgi:alanyl-tRNA synthetase
MMRNHTSEHLFVSELMRLIEGIELGYIWIDAEKGTVELLGEEIELDVLLQAEKRVQEYILKDLSVDSEIVDANQLDPEVRAREGVESQHEKIRIVNVKGVDQSACSGTHVTQTGDIGVFKISDYKIDQGNTRVEFISHATAMSSLTSVYNYILQRKNEYPFEIQQIGSVLDKAKRKADAHEDLLTLIVSLISRGNEPERINGIAFRSYILPGFESKDLKYVIQSVNQLEKSILVLFSSGRKCNLILQTIGLEKDATHYISDVVIQLGGRGGGRKDMYTGGFSEVNDPKQLFEDIIKGIELKIQPS